MLFDECDRPGAGTDASALPRKEQRVLARFELTLVAPSAEKQKRDKRRVAVLLRRPSGRKRDTSASAPRQPGGRPCGDAAEPMARDAEQIDQAVLIISGEFVSSTTRTAIELLGDSAHTCSPSSAAHADFGERGRVKSLLRAISMVCECKKRLDTRF